MGAYDNSRRGQSGAPNSRPLECERGQGAYDPYSIGKKFAEETKEIRGFSTSQIRQVLASTATIQNQIDRENRDSETLSKNIQDDIKYLKVKLAYQMGRSLDVKRAMNKNYGIDFLAVIENIGDSKEKFARFYRLMEAIVAYRRFDGEK